MIRILAIVGTRPEAIKMAPVVAALRSRSEDCQVTLCSSGQHREMVGQALDVFDLKPDITLDVMRPDQSLSGLTARLFHAISETVSNLKPDWVIAQGDTTTVLVASIVSFYAGIKFGHVEAGLRTGNMGHPFPEEMNRVFADRLATLHFAPTEHSREILLKEGFDESTIRVTGNTVVDAVDMVRKADRLTRPAELAEGIGTRRTVLITAHRRESFGHELREIFSAIVSVANQHPEIDFVFPVHPNPNVRKPADELLGTRANIHLIDPVDYTELGWLLEHSELVLTDSGGIQEEAPSYGVPALVMRDTTERPEGVEAGAAILVGRSADRIIEVANAFLSGERSVELGSNPYGDGTAGEQIANLIIGHGQL